MPPPRNATERSPVKAPRVRRGSGGVTIFDVASLAGVSTITVSRALRTPDKVSPDTLVRVREAVARTRYVPNLLAGGLASNRSRLVAALVPTVAGPVFLETIQALTESLDDAGIQLTLGQTGYGASRERALLDAIIGRRPDGIVLTGVMRSRDGRQRLKASGIPVVETWDLSSSPIDMLVGFSHREVGVAAAEYLHSHGCRAPALITADDERAGRRRTGFVETLQAHGVRRVPVVSVAAPSSLANGRFAFAQLLDQHPKIDAIFCSSDVLAQGVLTEATARGIEVPARLSVLGFGDLAFAAHLHPALTTVRIDGTSIGRTAAQFIVDRVEGRAIAKPICDIGFSIVERASVRSVG